MRGRIRRIACLLILHRWSCPITRLAGTGHFAMCVRCFAFVDEYGTVTPD